MFERVTKMKRIIMLIVVAACMAGCVSITPQELQTFKAQLAEVKNMSAKCAAEPVANCCAGLAAAQKAMETFVVAAED
jgi:hypothetical protein